MLKGIRTSKECWQDAWIQYYQNRIASYTNMICQNKISSTVHINKFHIIVNNHISLQVAGSNKNKSRDAFCWWNLFLLINSLFPVRYQRHFLYAILIYIARNLLSTKDYYSEKKINHNFIIKWKQKSRNKRQNAY